MLNCAKSATVTCAATRLRGDPVDFYSFVRWRERVPEFAREVLKQSYSSVVYCTACLQPHIGILSRARGCVASELSSVAGRNRLHWPGPGPVDSLSRAFKFPVLSAYAAAMHVLIALSPAGPNLMPSSNPFLRVPSLRLIRLIVPGHWSPRFACDFICDG